MAEIKKEGKLPESKCPKCNCEFYYTKEDVEIVLPYFPVWLFTIHHYVKCPCCKEYVRVQKQ